MVATRSVQAVPARHVTVVPVVTVAPVPRAAHVPVVTAVLAPQVAHVPVHPVRLVAAAHARTPR